MTKFESSIDYGKFECEDRQFIHVTKVMELSPSHLEVILEIKSKCSEQEELRVRDKSIKVNGYFSPRNRKEIDACFELERLGLLKSNLGGQNPLYFTLRPEINHTEL